MSVLTIAIIAVFVGGISASIQGPAASLMGQKMSSPISIFIMHLGGLIVATVLMLTNGTEKFRNWSQLPWYVFLAGGLGVVVLTGFTYAIPKLGAGTSTAIFVGAQLLTSMLIDHFGIMDVAVHSISWTRVLGVIVMVAGAYLISR